MYGLIIQISAFLFFALLSIVYIFKKRMNSIETNLYLCLIIINIIGLILDISSTSLALFYKESILLNPISKLYLVYLITISIIFVYYTIYISYSKKALATKKAITILIGIIIILSTICLVLPLYNFSEGNIVYTYGMSADYAKVIGSVSYIIMLYCIFRNFKNVKIKKYIPLLGFVILGVIGALIQIIYPEILVITYTITYVTFAMYFTIENPDMRLIEQLNIARDQAERANNAKSEFLSNMSHEIRTPLNAIVGFSQALSEEENVPESAKDEIKDIMMASQNLLEIVNGILDISKIEANKLEIVNTEYSLKNVLEELTSLTKARIGEKPIILRTVFDPSIPSFLYGDYVRLKQIVLNLLTNAAKYTKEGYIEFKVDFVIKEEICRLIISVEDTGIGIKQENIDKLFNKFERLDLEKNITIEGTGLGLAITKKLVELMNGSIVVQSEYGNGSKFTVAIDQRIVEGKEINDVDMVSGEIELFDASNKKVLVVDDNKINLKVAVRSLQNYKVQVDQAISGQECIDKIKQGEKYDLILLDDMMPKMSGVETLKELKKMDGFQIPTIAFTANAISGMKEKYLNDGFDDYLSKPIDKLELNHLLVKYLKEGEK